MSKPPTSQDYNDMANQIYTAVLHKRVSYDQWPCDECPDISNFFNVVTHVQQKIFCGGDHDSEALVHYIKTQLWKYGLTHENMSRIGKLCPR